MTAPVETIAVSCCEVCVAIGCHGCRSEPCTAFAGMSTARSQKIGDRLRLAPAIQSALDANYDLTIFLLGESYLHALNPHALCDPGRPVLTLLAPSARRTLPEWLQRGALDVSLPEAKRFGAGLVSLKGKLFALLAGTAFDITDPTRSNLTRAIEDSFAPFMYNGQMMDEKQPGAAEAFRRAFIHLFGRRLGKKVQRL